MTEHTTLVKSYPDDDRPVTDAEGWVDYLCRGDSFHLIAVCLTATGAYVAVLAFIHSAKGM